MSQKETLPPIQIIPDHDMVWSAQGKKCAKSLPRVFTTDHYLYHHLLPPHLGENHQDGKQNPSKSHSFSA